MKINLNEIPENGREFELSHKSAELTSEIKDLVGSHPYEVKFSITPLNTHDYELKGQIQTTTSEICSLCGETFNFKINTRLHEILIQSAGPDKELEKQSRSNHFSELNESGPSVTEYHGHTFEVGEFSHQAIALSVPFNPKPEADADGNCKVCLKMNLNQEIKYDEDMGNFEKAKEKENPFNVLKNLKQTLPKSRT